MRRTVVRFMDAARRDLAHELAGQERRRVQIRLEDEAVRRYQAACRRRGVEPDPDVEYNLGALASALVNDSAWVPSVDMGPGNWRKFTKPASW